MELSTTIHRDLAAVTALGPQWQALHHQAGDRNPFNGPDWPLAWLEQFGDGRTTPCVVEVRESGRLVGVAPLYRQSTLAGAATALEPIGTGAPWCGPYELPSLLVAPQLARDVTRAVLAALGEVSEQWDWVHLLPGRGVPWLEPEWLPDVSYTVTQGHSRGFVVVDLTRDDLFAGRRNLKESFRRARNRLTRDVGSGGWSVRRVGGFLAGPQSGEGDCPVTDDPREFAAAFNRLADLHGSRAGLHDGRPVHPDTLADPRVRAVVRSAVTRMARRGAASVYELELTGEVVAAQLVLHTRTASYSSLSGVSDRAWPYSAVTYLQSVAMQDAQKAGHVELNLSSGPNQAKLRWSDTVVVTPEFTVVAPRGRAQVSYLVRELLGVAAGYRAARRAHRR